MSEPQPEQEHPDTESMFDFLDDERANEGERATSRQPAEKLFGARRTMPIIRKPVPVSESGPNRAPGQGSVQRVESDEFDFLQRRTDEGRVANGRVDEGRVDKERVDKGRVDEGRLVKGRLDKRRVAKGRVDEGRVDEGRVDEGRLDKGRLDKGRLGESKARPEPAGTIEPFEDDLRPDSKYERQFAEEVPAPDGSLLRRSLGLFALLLVACGAVLYTYDYWPTLNGWTTGAVSSASRVSVDSESGAASESDTSGVDPDLIPAEAGSMPRPDSIGARFRDNIESLETLLAEGRLDEAEAQISRIDRTVYGYGFSEFSAIENRIADARNGVVAAPAGDVERQAEQERVAEQARATDAARLADEARLAEEARIAEEVRIADAARTAEAARLADEKRLAEDARSAAAARLAEAARVAQAARAAEAAAARTAEQERLAAAARSSDSRQLADDIAQLEGAARIAEAERRADAAATNALVTAASGSSAADKADAVAAARVAARAAAQERASEVERRRAASADVDATERVPTDATRQGEVVAGSTGLDQRAADRRATTLAADRAATDRRIAEQRDKVRRETGTVANSATRSANATAPSDAPTRPATDVVSASPRTTAPEPERTDTLSGTSSATTAERPVIGDADLQLVYGRFIELENAIEQRDIEAVIALTRPSGARIQQFLQVFENSEALEARITNVSMRKADSEITGLLRIDTIRRSDGSRVRPPSGLESVALSSTRDDSGWSALVW